LQSSKIAEASSPAPDPRWQSKNSVIEFIRSGSSSDNYVTQREILSFVASNVG
jgi:hypothetical protein